MKKYKAHLCQHGEGCDYTIGCGHAVIDLKAQNIEDAKIELADRIRDSYSSMETSLESAVIFEISDEFELNVTEYYKELERKRREEERAYREQKEREEFERLKQKYGN